MLVYPPNQHETESETIFFIGSANESCVINGQNIDLVYAGNFCPVFPLELGENIFKIEIDGKIEELKIIRRHSEQSLRHPERTIRHPERAIRHPERAVRHPEAEPKDLSEISKRLEQGDPSLSLRMTDSTLRMMDESPMTTKAKRICLDPGHGGSQRGTCSPKGVAEKDLNLSLALKIKTQLEQVGIEVKLTREDDNDLSLQERVDICKDFNSDLFISIHHNAIPDNLNPLEHYGLSVHYYYEDWKELADNYSSKLSDKLQLKNNGAIQQNLHVLRENKFCPALLIEFGFLIHPEESERLVMDDFQNESSKSLAKILP